MIRIVYLALVGALLLISGCHDQQAIKKLGLVYCAEGSPSHFNPQLDTASTVRDVTSRHLYDRLVEIHPISQQLTGGLATSWSVSEDGTRYRFQLRPKVQFHSTDYFQPNRTLNADDVIFTFNRVLDPNHPYHEVSGGEYSFFDNIGFTSFVKEIHKIDEHTVEFELTFPNASFISSLATESAIILSQEYGERLINQGSALNQLDTHPIGTGPFKYDEYQNDHFVRYIRHWHHWRGGAPFNKVIFDITPNPSTRLAKLLTSQCDIMAQPAALQLDVLEHRDNLMLSIQSGINTAYLALNTERPVFYDRDVRQAIAQSIDKQRLIEAVYLNTGRVANNILPPASWAYRAPVAQAYNPEPAQKRLKGVAERRALKPLKLWVLSDRRSYNPNPRKIAQLLQNDFAQMGFALTIEAYDWNVLRRKLKHSPDYDMLLIGWIAQHSDPDSFFRQQFSCEAISQGYNYSRWCNHNFDRLLDRATHTDRLAERIRIYHQIQAELEEHMPVIPLAYAYKLYAYNDSIEGITWNPYGSLSFNQAFRK